MHILALPFPTLGHVNPMMHLCRRLLPLGFEITFIVTHRNGDAIDTTVIDGIRFISMADGMPEETIWEGNLQRLLNDLEAGMKESVENVVRDLMTSSSPVTCILSDAFIGWTRYIADIFHIARASFWTSCATWNLISFNLTLLKERGLLPASEGGAMIDFIPGIPPIAANNLPMTIRQEDVDDPGFEARIFRMELMKRDEWVLCNTFCELEYNVIEELQKMVANYVPVGPIIPPPANESRDEASTCLEWLGTHPASSVIYVSFGSLAKLSSEQIEQIAIGLECSKVPFLWVVRPGFMKGESEKMKAILSMCRKGLIVSWASQLEVLKHDSVAAFLTHCGWNSVLESVSAGVPMLGWPCIAEQRLNCALIVDYLKIGMRISEVYGGQDPLVEARQVEKAVKMVVSGHEGKEMKEKVAKLKIAASTALLTSNIKLQAFAEDMRNSCAK